MLTLLFSGCGSEESKPSGTQINLSDNKITVDGKEITSDETQAVYSANDIVFYLAGKDFTYGEGEKKMNTNKVKQTNILLFTSQNRVDMF